MAAPSFISKLWKTVKSSGKTSKLAPIIGALIGIIPGVILYEFRMGQELVNLSYDLPFRFRADIAHEEAVIIYMDEESFKKLEQKPSQPWSRKLHADLIKRVMEDGAKGVILDTIFTEPAAEEETKALAEAMRAHRNVIMGAQIEGLEETGTNSILYSAYFRDVAASAIVDLPNDHDLAVRRHFKPGIFDGESFVPTISWKAAQLAGAAVTRTSVPENEERWVNYYGPPGYLVHASYHNYAQAPPGFFKDKTVFVGVWPLRTGMPGESKEEYATPYTFWTNVFAPGVEIHATMFLNLLHGDWLRKMPHAMTLLLLVGMGAAAGVGLTVLRPLVAAPVAAGAILLVFGAAWISQWKLRVWFPWVIIAAVQVPATFIWSLAYNNLKLHIEKRILSRTLELHLSPQRVKQILAKPELLAPGAERQEVSILFSDIANFSKVTSRMDPDDLFRLLNRYFQESLTCIHETDGTVVKLIGDAIFAIWNAPFTQPNQQERACQAALLLRDRLVQFDSASRGLPLRTRVGLHTGMACVGNVGSAERFDYTAIGDAINLASRLEGLNKYVGTQVLATRQIQKVVEDKFVSRKVGYFRFKGMDHVTEVYELIGTRDEMKQIPEYIGVFEKALHSFERKSFAAAESGFRETLSICPDDGPANFYLHKLEFFRAKPPAEDWAGEIDLDEK